jgi:glycine betaine/proline transport system permease protein
MDWLNRIAQLISDNKIPIGKWAASVVEWITDNFAWFFNGVSDGLSYLMDNTTAGLSAVPALLLILIICGIAYLLHRRWALVIGVALGLLLILNLGFWDLTVETIVLMLYSTLVSLLIGIPVGIYAARRPAFYAALQPVLDMMQTLPPFVYLIPTMILFGLGSVPGLFSTVIFAVPVPIRATREGLVGVPTPLIEAGESFGSTRRQLLFKVEIPHAMPLIMLGVNQTIMMSLSMVVIATLVGAGGLGVPVMRALTSVNVAQGIEAGLAIVIVAIVMDRTLKRPAPGAGRKQPKA